MKKIIIYIIAIIIANEVIAQTSPLLNRWSYHTAYLMHKNKYESGIVQPFRYGISDRVEITTNVLQNIAVPNAGVKVFIADVKGFHMASEHGLQYNSLFFKLLSRKGIAGILSPQFPFPNLFTFSSSFLVTKQIFDTAYVTARAGFFLGMRDGYLSPLATVDLPVIYPRNSHLFNKCTFRLGADIRGKIKRSWGYMFDLQFFVLPISEHNFFMENTGVIMCNWGKHCRFKGGYKLCYGDYPFGKQWHLLPTLDIVFGSK